MPTFRKLSAEEIAARRPRVQTKLDLTEYLSFLEDLKPGDGGELALQEGETQRAIKRRLTTAGKQQEKTILWRSSPDGVLRFEVRGPSSVPSVPVRKRS